MHMPTRARERVCCYEIINRKLRDLFRSRDGRLVAPCLPLGFYLQRVGSRALKVRHAAAARRETWRRCWTHSNGGAVHQRTARRPWQAATNRARRRLGCARLDGNGHRDAAPVAVSSSRSDSKLPLLLLSERSFILTSTAGAPVSCVQMLSASSTYGAPTEAAAVGSRHAPPRWRARKRDLLFAPSVAQHERPPPPCELLFGWTTYVSCSLMPAALGCTITTAAAPLRADGRRKLHAARPDSAGVSSGASGSLPASSYPRNRIASWLRSSASKATTSSWLIGPP